jgi:hypothetical protein
MNRRSLLRLALAGAGLAAAGRGARAGDFVPLYNGRDLSGWHVQNGKLESWKANGELISCVAPGGGYLTTDGQYADFELKLEYRIGPAGNSGVGLRYPTGGHPSTAGMELQILDDQHPRYAKLNPLHRHGSIYTHSAPKAQAATPPGEWNGFLIRCHGPRVVVHLNGVEIQDLSLDDYGDSLGKGTIPLARRPRKGHIGLQSHGDLVDFRKIALRIL